MLKEWPTFWRKKTLLSIALIPFSLIISTVQLVRYYFMSPKKVNAKVICVGNVTLGGAGKTPTAIAICNILKEMGHSVAFISRGYKGSLSSSREAVRVNANIHSYNEVGDEPLLLCNHAPTFICKDRYKAALKAVAEGVDYIIMDDGLQNYSIKKDLSLLVINPKQVFGNGLVMPAGPMREPLKLALKKTHAIILRGSEVSLSSMLVDKQIPVLTTMLKIKDKQKFAGKKYVAVSSIAHFDNFLETIKQADAQAIGKCQFPDHHIYTAMEIENIYMQAKQLGCKVITTTKDAVKLRGTKLASIIEVLEVEVNFDDERDFVGLISHI